MTDTRTALTAYLRGSFSPPLPHAYVDWVGTLLDDMQAAVTCSELGDDDPINHRVEIPDAVVRTGAVPRIAVRQGDVLTIRLGDLISALRLYDRFAYSTTTDDDDDTESE